MSGKLTGGISQHSLVYSYPDKLIPWHMPGLHQLARIVQKLEDSLRTRIDIRLMKWQRDFAAFKAEIEDLKSRG